MKNSHNEQYKENKCQGFIIENGILFNGTNPHYNPKNLDTEEIIPKVKAPRGNLISKN